MPETEIKKWFAATASGVAYLHKHGIVHRDLKPGNIFRDDDQHIVKIGDYGLSKFIACNRKSGQTEAVGTFHYMAPEIGNGVYGKEIDIYALGILLFEMLTGDVPFNGESSQEIIMKHLTANVPLERVPPAFHRVALKSLNKDPQYRYASVQEMVKELPWRDLATNSETITAQYAMGHPSLMNAGGCDNQPPVSYGKAKIAPIFITGDALEILKEDIVFGETEAASPSAEAIETAPRVRRNPAVHKSTAPHPSDTGSTPAKAYTSDRVKEDLRHRFTLHKTAQQRLKTAERTLALRQTSLNTAFESLEKAQAQQRELQVKIETLNARNRMNDLVKTTSNYDFDDSQLARTRAMVDDISARIETEEEMLNLAPVVFGQIPVNKDTGSTAGNLLQELDEYFNSKDSQTDSPAEQVDADADLDSELNSELVSN
ncbi:serine/threonine protein kinase, partial [bacterium]|nr:serine/threonine protein kinase [bacterium]